MSEKPVQLKRSKQVEQFGSRVVQAKSVGLTHNAEIAADFIDLLPKEIQILLTHKMKTKGATLEGWERLGTTKNVVSLVLETLLALVNHSYARLDAADLDVLREQGEDQEALIERNTGEDLGHGQASRLRKRLEADYGEAYVARLGLAGTLPQSASRLKAKLTGAAHVLKAEKKLPDPLDPGSPVYTFAGLESQFERLLQGLGDSDAEVKREAKETEKARLVRQERSKELRAALNAYNFTFEYLTRLVGKEEIADRIRLSRGHSTPENDAPTPPQQEEPTGTDHQ